MKSELESFSRLPSLLVATSSKKDGGMKIRYEMDYDAETLQNRQEFVLQLGISDKDVVTAKLAQGDTVAVVSKDDRGSIIHDTDSLITKDKGVFLAITTADCLSVFLYDSKHGVIALIHAGWKGLELGTIAKTIERMHAEYGTLGTDLMVGIGAGIGVCHFEVQQDVADRFVEYKSEIQIRDGKIFIDLKQIAAKQLLRAGISENSIEVNPDCTYHNEEYFSFRRDKTSPLQANLVLFGMR